MADPTPSKNKPPLVQPTQVRPWLAAFGVVALIVLVVSIGLASSRSPQSAGSKPKSNGASGGDLQAPTVPAPLSGRPVPIDVPLRRPWGVMIENLPEIRPQSSLSSADLVIEAPTEGGITRALALFQSQLPTGLIGPVRSARPYFNDWASTFRALYSHSGGSAEALKQLKSGYGELIDVNEFFNGDAYERLPDRKAPHNLFTSAERFWNYLIARDLSRTVEVPRLTFREPEVLGAAASSVTIPYYPAEYRVRYDWRSQDQSYLRAVGGTTQFDAVTNLPLRITNVLVLITDVTPVPRDPLLKVNIRTLGDGPAILFSRGARYDGTWAKADLASPLIFTGSDGQPLPLAPGNTWISVIDAGLEASLATEP